MRSGEGGTGWHAQMPHQGVESRRERWVREAMTDNQTHDTDPDQDADPPTPDGAEPDTEQLRPDSEPASDPDPAPDAGSGTGE